MTEKSNIYKEAGVDIDLAEGLIDSVTSSIKKTYRKEVLNSSRSFGGLFRVDVSRYPDPVLVSSIDGVGTKLLLANMMNSYRTIGYDLVNHCVNDVACQGAEPLYFMDYLGIGQLRDPLFSELLSGLTDACQSQGISLLGGETAEMPGMYGNDFDLVGAITGVVDRSRIISGEKITHGDAIIGLGSSGLHTNGYSLARKVLFQQSNYSPDSVVFDSKETLGEILLKPHICYWPVIKEALAKRITIHGIAHITGGGFYNNISRILPPTLDATIHNKQQCPPKIFTLIQEKGEISNAEMYKVFNMGIGMVWILPEFCVDSALSICQDLGFCATRIGEIEKGTNNVKISGIDFGPGSE